MGKGAQEAGVGVGREDTRARLDVGEGARGAVHAAGGRGRVVLRVQVQVGERKVDLTEDGRPRAERARGEHAGVDLVGQRGARVDVAGKGVEGGLVVAPKGRTGGGG